MIAVYVACTLAGLALILAGLVLDDMFDAGPDWLSAPVAGAALAAFGMVGWASDSLAVAAGVAVVFAVAVGVVFAVAAAWLVANMREGHTDPTPSSSDLPGLEGRVVTAITGGTGEILATHAGQRRKLTAVCGGDVDEGTRVVITEVLSESSVRVVPTEMFWSEIDPTSKETP